MARPEKRDGIMNVVLEAEKDLAAKEIGKRANACKKTAKKHLDILEENGIVKVSRKIGRVPLYEANLG